MEGHNLVVIGASAGGIETISRLLGQLPVGLPAAVFVVQHISANSPGRLHKVLGRHASLPVTLARHDEPIRQGHVYVAPPDCHLLVKKGFVHVVHGPRENRTRPAIDPLFRSAAVAYGARVIGVLLTGLLDDGSAGLLAIRRCGGIVIVQDPNDARYPDMPRNALEYLTADYRLPLAEIGKVLTQLIYQAAGKSHSPPKNLKLEVTMAEGNPINEQDKAALGEPTDFSCPECGGPLRKISEDSMERYRCHTGHGFTAKALLADQDRGLEPALWEGIRVLEERCGLYRSMANDARRRQYESIANDYDVKAQQSREHAQQIRNLVTSVFFLEEDTVSG